MQDLKGRFGIEDVTFVADGGVVSSMNLGDLGLGLRSYPLDERAKGKAGEDVLGSDQVRTREVHSEEGGSTYCV